MRSNPTPSRGSSGTLVATGLLALTVGLACGGEETPAASGGEPAGAKIEIPAAAETEKPVEAQVEVGKLPDSYPKDLPTFPGAKPTNSMLLQGGTGLILLSAQSPVDEVASFYAKALPEQGWNVDTSSNEGKRLQVSKGSRAVTLTIGESQDGVQIAIALSGGGA